mmetsp:Transcript_13992/g.34596  ORF Transcript_13992/g.34596 Transcript_13992/m.34596 type:complete len:254 (-) Transcript_13992:680-1441(-)
MSISLSLSAPNCRSRRSRRVLHIKPSARIRVPAAVAPTVILVAAPIPGPAARAAAPVLEATAVAASAATTPSPAAPATFAAAEPAEDDPADAPPALPDEAAELEDVAPAALFAAAVFEAAFDAAEPPPAFAPLAARIAAAVAAPASASPAINSVAFTNAFGSPSPSSPPWMPCSIWRTTPNAWPSSSRTVLSTAEKTPSLARPASTPTPAAAGIAIGAAAPQVATIAAAAPKTTNGRVAECMQRTPASSSPSQ